MIINKMDRSNENVEKQETSNVVTNSIFKTETNEPKDIQHNAHCTLHLVVESSRLSVPQTVP